MPKFTNQERELLYSKLRCKGELLFTKHGLKKVTVNDIAEKAGIGKGTFYHFYSSKEHLFMDIFNHIQREIYNGIDQFLAPDRTVKEKALETVRFLVQKHKEHPLLSMMSGETYSMLKCKVPEECLAQNDQDDFLLYQKASAVGILFKYPSNIVIKVIQSIIVADHAFSDDKDGQEVTDVLIQVVINSIIV